MNCGTAVQYLLGYELGYRHLLLQGRETYLRSHLHYLVAHHHLLIYFMFVSDADLLNLRCWDAFATVALEIFSF